jgi:predicted ATPase/DNA-binding SARP family transcriptional activator
VLALEPGRRLHRDQMLELLWPELGAAAAQNNLHQAVHAARRVVGADRLTLVDGMLELETDVATDVDTFETAARLAREQLEPDGYVAALDSFGGELLPEDRYEPWAEGRRSALNDLHSALCLELAELLEPQEAIEALQRALAVEPLHEPAHRALMRTYHAVGRRQDALAQYHRLRTALRTTLEADPDDESRALYRELLAVAPDDDSVAFAARVPPQLTSFVGREHELAAVMNDLADARVLTLTGPGGSGKTRLAIAVAERSPPAAQDGVFFVELAGIADRQLVGDATATAVGIRVPAMRTAAEAVAEHYGNRRVLLVLDTCEHVVDACAGLAETLLERCPEVTILATSREQLRCSGETVWRVPGLRANESLELFLSRARDADPAFDPDDRALHDIEALCMRLDGMPLALELAAARIASFAPAQIVARLDDSLDVLSGGRRTALTRQQTLRATITWSHDLLAGEERVLFRRLSVFAGSFSLDAAEDVCAGGAIEKRDIVDLLLRLVDKSLVIVEDAELARYRLLDTVRQFAAECLASAGERETVEARLRDWAQALAAEPPPLRQLELDHDNIRAALDSGLRNDPQGALRLAASVWRFWLDRNYFTEGARRLRAVLDAAPEATELRATTLLAAAALEVRCGRLESFMARGREAAALARRGRPASAADVLHRAGLLSTAGGTLDECARLCAEALTLAEDDATRASILSVSSLPHYYTGELAESRRVLDSALAALDAVPDSTPPFFEGITFGFAVLPEGPERSLRPVFEETIFLFHRFGRPRAIAYSLCNLALLERTAGRPQEAQTLIDEALARFRRLDDPRGEAHALAALGNCARTFGDNELGLAWLEQSLALRRRLGDRRAVAMTEICAGLVLAFGGDLEGASTIFREAHDRFQAADDAPGQGGALTTWGLAEERAGNLDAAAELFTAGAAIWERHLNGLMPGWTRLTAADTLLAADRGDDARAELARAERLLAEAGETRGVALCLAHPAAKSAQSRRK